MNIIPTINVSTEKSAREVIQKIKPITTDWVQFDVGDGIFSSVKTLNIPEEEMWLLNEFIPFARPEVHLMVKDPIKSAHSWIDAGAKRIILHIETVSRKSFEDVFSCAEKRKIRVMLALLPETPIEKLSEYPEVNEVMVLSVHPGLSGQVFIPGSEEKVRKIKEKFPHYYIEVDGGVNKTTAQLVARVHADAVAIGSYFSESKNIEADFNELRRLV